MGLRIALGATVLRVRRMVFGHLWRMTMTCGTIGAMTALVAGRVAESQLFQVSWYDGTVMMGAAFGIAVVAFVAGWLPAWRASRIDPAGVLRES